MIEKLRSALTGLLQKQTIPEAALEKYPQLVGYNLSRANNKRSAFCHAPSTNMYFSQTGEVKVCCHNAEFTAGIYPRQSLREIWNSDAAQQMRDAMKNFRLKGGCEICEADLLNKHYDEVRATHFDHIPVHKHYPTQMEFLLTNTCNLECVMCKGEFSSSIRQNREHLPPIKNVYDEAFIEQLREFIPHLHETRFSGSGEAFLIDVNYKIWELIIALNPKCKIMIQTNGTVLNSRIKDLLQKGNFQIGVSLDSLKKEAFEAIRPNAKFERVMENIQYFNAYCAERKHKFNISTCVMRQNWQELPEFVRFSNSIKAVQTFHKVWHPIEYALHNLPASELETIYHHFKSNDFVESTPLERLNRNHYQYFVKTVEAWMKDAQEVARKKQLYAQTDPARLKQLVMEKIALFLKERQDRNSAVVSAELCIYEQKIDDFIRIIPDKPSQEKALQQMAIVKTEDLVSSFKAHDAEALLFYFRKYESEL